VQRGQLAEAKNMQERALEMRKQIHGENHPDVALSLNSLAVTLGDMGHA